MMNLNNRAFTLIEIVTVIVVLAILGTFTFSFLENAVKTYVLVREQDTLYSDGTYIMERIIRELSDATAVSSPSAESTSSTLTFTKAHTKVDPTTEVTLTKSGRNLLRNTTPIGRNIKTFNVTRNLPAGALNETITIELELDSQKDSTIPSFSVKTKVTPNNYGTTGYTGRSFNGDYYENIK